MHFLQALCWPVSTHLPPLTRSRHLPSPVLVLGAARCWVRPLMLMLRCRPAVLSRLCSVQYKHEVGSLQQKLSGLTREELQRALGVKPMDKSSRCVCVHA